MVLQYFTPGKEFMQAFILVKSTFQISSLYVFFIISTIYNWRVSENKDAVGT